MTRHPVGGLVGRMGLWSIENVLAAVSPHGPAMSPTTTLAVLRALSIAARPWASDAHPNWATQTDDASATPDKKRMTIGLSRDDQEMAISASLCGGPGRCAR